MSVYKRTDTGRWIIDFTLKYPDGRKEVFRRTSPIQTKRAAEKYEQQLKEALLKAFDKPKQKKKIPTFAAYAEVFMNDCAKVQNKMSEQESKARILRNHLLPVFGKCTLENIWRDDIKQYRSKKLKTGLSAKTINNQVTVLCRILSEAVESGLIDFVPKLRRLPVALPKVNFLTPEEALALVDAAEGQWKVMIQLGLTPGCAKGS